MATSSRSAERFKYGICLNDECPLCKEKKVQQIPMRKDLVCTNPECGKPLRECPPPSSGGNKKLYGIIAGVVGALVIGGGIVALSGGDDKEPVPQPPVEVVPVDSDSIKAAQLEAENQRLKDSLAAAEAAEAAKEQEKTTPAPPEKTTTAAPAAPKAAKSGTKDLGYATFKGTWPNDVNGRMIFKTSHIIDSRDPKQRVAEAGDYIIGEFADGRLVQGIWYGADNQVKGSVIIGR